MLSQKSMPKPSVNQTEMGGMNRERMKPRIWAGEYLRILTVDVVVGVRRRYGILIDASGGDQRIIITHIF